MATTTTSPVACCSDRISDSISRALVTVDDVREIVDRLRQLGREFLRMRERDRKWRRPCHANEHRCSQPLGVADRDGVTSLCAPSVDSSRELFDSGQVLWEKDGMDRLPQCRIDAPDSTCRRPAPQGFPRRVHRHGSLRPDHCIDAVQAGNVPEEQSKGWRRGGDQLGDIAGAAARFDERFAKMDQVALGLQLARPPEVIRRNRRRT